MAVPILIGIQMLCYVAFCFTYGPWGGALDGTEATDIPVYVTWLIRVLFVMQIVAALVFGWRLAPHFKYQKRA